MSDPIIANGPAVIAMARTQLGVTEYPPFSNRQKYGAWYGMDGVAWCAMFVSWCYWHSGNPLPRITTVKGFAYCPEVVRHAKETGQWRPVGTYRPKAGDMILFSFGGVRADHVALVQGVLDDGRIHTIEGNTNAGGSRTGGGVYELYRRSKIMGYVEVRPKATPTPPPPPPAPPSIKEDTDVTAYIRLDQAGHPQRGRIEAVGDFHRRHIATTAELDLLIFFGAKVQNVDAKTWNSLTANKHVVDDSGVKA